MKTSTTWRLFLAVCIVGAVIGFVDRSLQSTDDRLKGEARLLDLRAEDVFRLTLEAKGQSIECVRQANGWVMVRPLRARVDEGHVDRILSVLEGARREEVISARQREERDLGLRDYGLDAPRSRVVVETKLRPYDLRIGADAPLGDFLYVCFGDGGDVVATSRKVHEVLPQQVDEMRDRTVVVGEAAKVTRVEIHRPDGAFLQIARTPVGWQLSQPIVERLDPGRVEAGLEYLFDLRVERFVWDGSAGRSKPVDDATKDPRARMVPYGLTPDEAMRVTVWPNGSDVGQELLIGKPAADDTNTVYAMVRDEESVFTVSARVTGLLSANVESLRDRRLFRFSAGRTKYLSFSQGDHKVVMVRDEDQGWIIEEPVKWKADDRVVEDVLRALQRLRAEMFMEAVRSRFPELGLDPPLCVIRVLDSRPATPDSGTEPAQASDPKTSRVPAGEIARREKGVAIGSHTNAQGLVSVFDEERPCVMGVLPDSLRGLSSDPTNPLLYRDRTILAIHPSTVRRVTLVRDGVEDSMSVDPDGRWRMETAASNVVDQARVQNLLFTVANLRGLSIVPALPGTLDELGLERPSASLTFGLTGGEGIQKTLLFGQVRNENQRYVMVQGQEVAFMIPPVLGHALFRPFMPESPVAPSAVTNRSTGVSPATPGMTNVAGVKAVEPSRDSGSWFNLIWRRGRTPE
jgi:hypothetical protein